MPNSTPSYWSKRYEDNNTPWDIGYPSTPLSAFFQNLTNKDSKILIPGAGNAYEAEWLWNNGFKNTFVVDIAAEPLRSLKNRLPQISEKQLIHNDFFNLEDQFDLIVEQTFFCALNPTLRGAYVDKMNSLLKPSGHLVGVLFDFELTDKGPPFGGSVPEYLRLFKPQFKVKKMEKCYNSIKPRQGTEVFVHLISNAI